jgi:hypothetical protein
MDGCSWGTDEWMRGWGMVDNEIKWLMDEIMRGWRMGIIFFG